MVEASVWKKDGRNISLLLFLYVLQGIPLGLSGAIPFILTQRKVSYSDQAAFSFSFWPFSIKLLWAPVVDSLFISKIGRRKTWLIPIQYLIGLALYYLSLNVDSYLEGDIGTLTAMFFLLNFLAATQDIAVDGWALTMLDPKNVGYASTCNSVGQTAGYFMGYVGYIGLESMGLVTLPGFMVFWCIIFITMTSLVAVFKSEKGADEKFSEDSDVDEDLGIAETYKLLFKILKLPNMLTMVIVLLTVKISFSATDSVTSLKLIENGVPKEKLAMLAIPMIPVQIILPLIISRYTSGPLPLNIFLKAMPMRLVFGLIFAGFVCYTPQFMESDKSFPWYYYALIVLIFAIHQIFTNCMFVSIMAFFSRISDPAVGGTYMTLLNTLTNLGGNWPATLALWMVDILTVKECRDLPKDNAKGGPFNCVGKETECAANGGTCYVTSEGYYLETAVCVVFGFVWLYGWGWKAVDRLQKLQLQDWRVVKSVEKSQ